VIDDRVLIICTEEAAGEDYAVERDVVLCHEVVQLDILWRLKKNSYTGRNMVIAA